MSTSIILILLTLLNYSCDDTRQNKTELINSINQKAPNIKQSDTIKNIDTNKMIETEVRLDTLPDISSGKMTLISSGQISPYKTVKINDYSFDLVTQENDTIYLATRDKKFRTPEGYKVGTRLSELPKNVQSELTKEPGWGYYYQLQSGWTLGFCEGNSCTDKYPKTYSEVKWIFKRQ